MAHKHGPPQHVERRQVCTPGAQAGRSQLAHSEHGSRRPAPWQQCAHASSKRPGLPRGCQGAGAPRASSSRMFRSAPKPGSSTSARAPTISHDRSACRRLTPSCTVSRLVARSASSRSRVRPARARLFSLSLPSLRLEAFPASSRSRIRPARLRLPWLSLLSLWLEAAWWPYVSRRVARSASSRSRVRPTRARLFSLCLPSLRLEAFPASSRSRIRPARVRLLWLSLLSFWLEAAWWPYVYRRVARSASLSAGSPAAPLHRGASEACSQPRPRRRRPGRARTEDDGRHGVALPVVVAGDRERAQVGQRRQRRQVARAQRVRAQLQALQTCARGARASRPRPADLCHATDLGERLTAMERGAALSSTQRGVRSLGASPRTRRRRASQILHRERHVPPGHLRRPARPRPPPQALQQAHSHRRCNKVQ